MIDRLTLIERSLRYTRSQLGLSEGGQSLQEPRLAGKGRGGGRGWASRGPASERGGAGLPVVSVAMGMGGAGDGLPGRDTVTGAGALAGAVEGPGAFDGGSNGRAPRPGGGASGEGGEGRAGLRVGSPCPRTTAAAVQLAAVQGWHVIARAHARGRRPGLGGQVQRGACDGGRGGHVGGQPAEHVTLSIFKRLSPQKVTQDSNWATHLLWCFGRARTTPTVKSSPPAISGTVNCCMAFARPNGVGESV